MAILFEARERAAEYGFAHEAEQQFLALRHGVEALGVWAATKIGIDPAAYVGTLVGDFLAGAAPHAVVVRVEADLARADLAVAPGEAGAVLDRSTAAAEADWRGTATRPDATAAALPAGSAEAGLEHRTHGFWGWDM